MFILVAYEVYNHFWSLIFWWPLKVQSSETVRVHMGPYCEHKRHVNVFIQCLQTLFYSRHVFKMFF